MFAVNGKRQVYPRAPSFVEDVDGILLKTLTVFYSLANQVKSRAQGVV
jgi:hypothetical protein